MIVIKPVLLIILCTLAGLAEVIELAKDDGSFEGCLVSYEDHYLGQKFAMPETYKLLSAKISIYLYATPPLLIRILDFDTEPFSSLIGQATLSNPSVGWNEISLTEIDIPPPQPQNLLVEVAGYSNIGYDIDPPLYGFYYQYGIYHEWYYNTLLNLGIRLVIDNNPLFVSPQTLGKIKMTYH